MPVKSMNNQTGFSLIEILVSMTIFTMTLIAATSILQAVINGQRNAISSQNIQENIRYTLEVISKEVRMTGQATSSCDTWLQNNLITTNEIMGGVLNTVNKIFNVGTSGSNNFLYFKNQYGECVVYYQKSNQLKVARKASSTNNTYIEAIMPSQVRINKTIFNVQDNKIADFASIQPAVTINLAAESVNQKARLPMLIQTTISGRIYALE